MNKAETTLAGRAVLIVEDEPFIAYDIASAIEEAGGIVIGPAMSLREALELVAERSVEAAILDVNLPDGDVGPVIEALAGKGVPLLLHTGAGQTAALRDRHPDLRIFVKPTPPPTLALVVASSLTARAPEH